MNKIVIYHANCVDGFGAAFAAWRKLGDEAKYVPMQYEHVLIDEESFKGKEVYILDFSLPPEQMSWLFQFAKKVVWIDHHKTAIDMWFDSFEMEERIAIEEKHTVILNSTACGALLAWEYFHPGETIPDLFAYIDDYDRWQFKFEETRALNKVIWSYAPWSFQHWDNLIINVLSGGLGELLREGRAILRMHNQNVASVVENGAMNCLVMKDFADLRISSRRDGALGLMANCPPHLSSDVGTILATRSGTYGLAWCMDSKKNIKCSIRSNGTYDVTKIAKLFGGGGHLNAAGFTVSQEMFKNFQTRVDLKDVMEGIDMLQRGET